MLFVVAETFSKQYDNALWIFRSLLTRSKIWSMLGISDFLTSVYTMLWSPCDTQSKLSPRPSLAIKILTARTTFAPLSRTKKINFFVSPLFQNTINFIGNTLAGVFTIDVRSGKDNVDDAKVQRKLKASAEEASARSPALGPNVKDYGDHSWRVLPDVFQHHLLSRKNFKFSNVLLLTSIFSLYALGILFMFLNSFSNVKIFKFNFQLALIII